MRLHTRQWGEGDRVAVLVHGMMGDSRQFHDVGPALAARGFRAVAVDLPGHGHSGTRSSGWVAGFAKDLVESVPGKPTMALGHSMGATVLAAAFTSLQPERAVYVDVSFQRSEDEGQDSATLTATLEDARSKRTVEELARSKPSWTPADREVEEAAARLFDVPTAVAMCLAADAEPVTVPSTAVPSLLIHADPSAFVSGERVSELRALGFDVRGVPGAGHSVWYGFVDEFMELLDDWLASNS